MNVGEWELHPWLNEELQTIKRFLEASKPILGICLGAQMLAHALGAKVTKMSQREIGIWPVTVTEEAEALGFARSGQNFQTTHWHSYQFDLPESAKRLLFSAACKQQGFIHNTQGSAKAIGLQCHFEADSSWVSRLSARESTKLTPSRYVQTANQIEVNLPLLGQANPMLEKILCYLFL